MNRRRYIGTAAAALGLATAGCLGRGESGVGTTADDETTDGETTDEPPADVTLSDVTVTPELVAADSPDSIGTFGDRDEQYVVATAAAEGSPAPERGSFALEAGGESVGATETVGSRSRVWGYDEQYGSGDATEGWIAFVLPKPLDAESAAITWSGGGRDLSTAAVERLGRPPTDFAVREFAVPETVTLGETATVSVTVENVGETDGTFVGAVNRIGPLVAYAPETAVSLEVAAGETATWEYDHEVTDRGVERDAEDITMRFALDWRDDHLTRTIDDVRTE